MFAKIALVNRLYSTNLQWAGANIERRLAEHLVKARVDDGLVPLRQIEKLDRSSIAPVVGVHEWLVEAVKKVTRRVENSFCAKYLSFHFPKCVPIFDGYAYENSWRVVKSQLPRGLYPDNWNRDFAYHAEAVLRLTDVLVGAGITDYSLKRIDYVLYSAR